MRNFSGRTAVVIDRRVCVVSYRRFRRDSGGEIVIGDIVGA